MPSGGKRIGAGRKPGEFGTKVPLTVKLTPDVIEYLKETYPDGAAGQLESLVRKTKSFKEWLAKRQK